MTTVQVSSITNKDMRPFLCIKSFFLASIDLRSSNEYKKRFRSKSLRNEQVLC